MRSSESRKFRPLSHSGNKNLKTSEELLYLGDDQASCSALKGEDIQDPATHPWDLNKVHVPKPPKGQKPQKPAFMASVRQTHPADEVRAAVAHPVNLDPDSQPLDYTGIPGLQFDDQGMLLPHCILGSLEDFRRCLEAKGETELVKRIPKSQIYSPSEAPGRHHSEAAEISSAHRNIQSNALQNWRTRMTQRRQQQDVLSDLLDRPVEILLMNQSNRFRETQELREFLNQVTPLIHSGYTEQGRREPVTHVGQPSSIRQESGINSAETVRSATRTWDQSAYLQQRCQELREALPDMDIKKPDIDGLVVIGSSEPFSFITTRCGPLLKKEEEETEDKKTETENLDPLAPYEDVRSDPLCIPALTFCGQLASWTGNSTTSQGEVGISATIFFEATTGETASNHLELHNEGSTAIFYSWQQLHVPQSFAHLEPRTTTKGNFHFNSSSGVICPGETQQVKFIFKPKGQGINTELWQLITHPVLLQGASMQVTLTGVGLYLDKTAAQRQALETDLEKRVAISVCQETVYEIVRGVGTPERPSSPAELYVTEEQEFLSKNAKLQYLHQSVEDLKRLWQEVQPGHTWDLSVDTLRQAVLSLPRRAQENSLAQLNFLLLQLSEAPRLKQRQLTPTVTGQLLWRNLLDTMDGEALRLRNLLGLPERDTWDDQNEEDSISDAPVADKEKRRGARCKDDNKGESKSATADKLVEDSKKKGRRKKEVVKHTREKPGKELAPPTDTSPGSSVSQQPPDDQNVEHEEIYLKLLHNTVYALVEDLVDNLCAMMDDLKEGDTQTHTIDL